MNKVNSISTERRIYLPLLVLVMALTILLISSNTAKAINPDQQLQLDPLAGNNSAAISESDEAANPAWLEPRPLSIVDLISGGLDPALMAGSPISWIPGFGLLQFTSGAKSADGVSVNAKMLPVSNNVAFCLGQWGSLDQWPISVPASTMQIRSNGADITGEILQIEYWVTGLVQPIANTNNQRRYETKILTGDDIKYASDGRLLMPENMGCSIYFKSGAADRGNITINYEHDLTHYISIGIVDQEIDYEFKSYYHDSDQGFGQLASLSQQISDMKEAECGSCSGNRHDKMVRVPPEEANYVLMVFPPVPVDPYAPIDKLRALKRFEGAGTYRVRENKADYRDISVDWITMAGIPLNFHAKDADFSSGEKYLDYFKVKGEHRFHALEVVALNNEFQECMHSGGCSEALLKTISGTRMNVDFYFLKVDRVTPGLTQIPLCSVGPGWNPSDAGTKCNDFRIARSGDSDIDVDVSSVNGLDSLGESPTSVQSLFAPSMDHFLYLPMISNPLVPESDNPTAECPCGWFAEDGRMLGYVEPPGS